MIKIENADRPDPRTRRRDRLASLEARRSTVLENHQPGEEGGDNVRIAISINIPGGQVGKARLPCRRPGHILRAGKGAVGIVSFPSIATSQSVLSTVEDRQGGIHGHSLRNRDILVAVAVKISQCQRGGIEKDTGGLQRGSVAYIIRILSLEVDHQRARLLYGGNLLIGEGRGVEMARHDDGVKVAISIEISKLEIRRLTDAVVEQSELIKGTRGPLEGEHQ